MKSSITYFTGFVGMALIFASLPIDAQNNSTTYTVDPSFDSGNLFRDGSGISSIVPYNDGRILVGGGFSPLSMYSPFRGLGMVWGDGSEYTQWGGGETMFVTDLVVQEDGILYATTTGFGKVTSEGEFWFYAFGQYWGSDFIPFNIESTWCLYEQEDGKVLLGGAIATDTTQPYLFRNLVRMLPDGSHDTTFPAIEVEPNIIHSRILTIDKDSEGRWLVSGNFYAINGHETAFVARLNPDFSVDTTYVSGLKYVFSVPEPHIVLMDSQDRLWLTHGNYMVAQNNPLDTVDVLRLLPSGAVDTTFVPRHTAVEYPPGSVPHASWAGNLIGGLELAPDRYMLYGWFNYWNDTVQHCITVVDDAGYIQPHYFMGGGATEHSWNNTHHETPSIRAVEPLPDGSLIVGGRFSKFMGTTHYNLVKLNRGTIGTKDQKESRPVFVHPNPARESFWLTALGAHRADVAIHDLSGRVVYRGLLNNETTRISTASFAPGMYLIHVKDEHGAAVKKIVVE